MRDAGFLYEFLDERVRIKTGERVARNLVNVLTQWPDWKCGRQLEYGIIQFLTALPRRQQLAVIEALSKHAYHSKTVRDGVAVGFLARRWPPDFTSQTLVLNAPPTLELLGIDWSNQLTFVTNPELRSLSV